MGTLKMQAHETKGLCSQSPASLFECHGAAISHQGREGSALYQGHVVAYTASRSSIFGTFTPWNIIISSFISISRTVGLTDYAWTTNKHNHQTFAAILFFALGGISRWPFALALLISFVLKELFVDGKDRIKLEVFPMWIASNQLQLVKVDGLASPLLVPVVAIDSLMYGKLPAGPWDIVRY